MLRKHIRRVSTVVLLIGAVALAVPPKAWPQASPNPPGQSKAQPAPPWIVYDFFFQQVLAFDAKADQKDQAGQSGAAVRGYFASKAKLTRDEAQTLKTAAANCEAQARTLDAQAQWVIASYRAQVLKNPDGPKPEVPKVLASMQDQRDKTIKDSIEGLRKALGEQSFKNLDDYVQKEFAPNVHVARIGDAPPQPPGNGKR